MGNKLVIVSTIYKAEDTLPRLLDSLMKQKSENLEFFLIDNGSPDSCGKICEEYAKRDKRFTVYHLPENIGYIGARKWAFERVEGDYFTLADSDDYVVEGAYDKILEILDNNVVDFLVCSHIGFNEKGGYFPTKLQFDTGMYVGANFEKIKLSYAGCNNEISAMPGFMWRSIYKTEIVKRNNIELHDDFIPMEDRVFNFDYISSCRNIYLLNEPIYYFYSNSKSVTAKIDIDWFEQERKIYEHISEKFKPAEYVAYKTAAANIFMINAVNSIYNAMKSKRLIESIDYVKSKYQNSSFIKAITVSDYCGNSFANKVIYRLLKNKQIFVLAIILWFAGKLKTIS